MFEHSYAPCTALEEAKYDANNQLGPYYEYSVARNMLETLAKRYYSPIINKKDNQQTLVNRAYPQF